MDGETPLDQVLGVLARAFPDDRFQELELAKDGWDNLVVIADQSRVFRIPRRPDYPRFEERWALGKLRDKVTVAIPRIDRWSDDPPCMGYPILPGVSAPPEWLDAPSDDWVGGLAHSLAGFLHQCHQAIGLGEAKAAGLRGFSLSPYSPGELLDRAVGMDPGHRRYAESILRVAEKEDPGEPESFLYGDLHLGNLLFDPVSRRLSAVLDFGNVGWGGHSGEFYDLAGSWPALCRAVVDDYGKISGIKINEHRIRRHAVIFCLSVFAEDRLGFMRLSATKRLERLRKGEF